MGADLSMSGLRHRLEQAGIQASAPRMAPTLTGPKKKFSKFRHLWRWSTFVPLHF